MSKLSGGAMPVGIKDVARHAGVAVGTVSNVLNRPQLVALATRERVRASIEVLGFVRNEPARQLRAGHSRMIGMVVLDVANPYFTDVASGAEEAAAEAGLALMLCNSAEQSGREARHLDLLSEQRVKGVLITPVDAPDDRIKLLRERGTPVVLVDRHAGSRGQCSVAVDDLLGGELAGRHLIEQGHDRMAFVGGPFAIRQVQDRYDGMLRALAAAQHGHGDVVVFETPALSVAAGRDAAAGIADTPLRRRPTAIFCANDLLALGVLQEMTRRGLAVPGDIALVGYDDIDFAAAAAVPLTSVRQPRRELGRTAAELLIEEATAPERHKHRQVVFSPELVVRESSRQRRRSRRSSAAAPGAAS